VNYLLDTNHWSHLQKSHPALMARVNSLPDDATLYISVVSQGELLAGIDLTPPGARKQLLEAWYRDVASKFVVLQITPDVARHYARIFAALRRAGTPIETNDIWIAAIAQAYDLTVASADRHFRFVSGLPVEDWTVSE